MTAGTRIDAGIGHTSGALRRLCADGRTAVVLDAGVPSAAAAAASVPLLAAEPWDVSKLGPDVSALAEHLRRAQPSRIVVVGGGTTIDAAKLALLACVDEPLFAYARRSAAGRAVTMLPGAESVAVPLIAVPTTPGTSSEVNAVAVMTTERGHRLVVGAPLRPVHALLDGETLLSLTAAAMREGAFEALLRVAGMATGTRAASAGAIDLAVSLVAAGHGRLDGARSRLRIAILSAATVRTPVQRGSSPAPSAFSMRHWYVANELSFALGVRKIPATIAVIAAIWRRIDAGDRRWGEREGLRSLWHPVADSARLPTSPADGILALIRRWGLGRPARPGDDAIERIAAATELAWGGALPALRDIGADDIASVLHDGAWEPRAHSGTGSRAEPAHHGRR